MAKICVEQLSPQHFGMAQYGAEEPWIDHENTDGNMKN